MHTTPGAETADPEPVHVLLGEHLERAPVAMDEGLASLYEVPVLSADGSITGETNWRCPEAVSALSHREGAGPGSGRRGTCKVRRSARRDSPRAPKSASA